MSTVLRLAFALAVGTAVLALALAGLWVRYREARDERPDFRAVAYVGSESCFSCHRGRHASWHRTFHRSMTQEARPESVLAPFDGRALDFQGVRTRPLREGDRFFFEYSDPATGEIILRARVVRTVGSRRYQQYLTQDPERSPNLHRLHWLWHMGEQRFVHLNAAFLGPDHQGFDDHVSTWNQNCIFCHNTGPRPGVRNLEALGRRIAAGEAVDSARELEYDSSVAELGIACESCHAPGARHVEASRDPLRRLAFRLFGWDDPTIVHPARLGPWRSAQVCGQCHGQRLPPDPEALARWLSEGPDYRPGDDLHAHVTLLWPETEVPGQPGSDLFALRFWPDRTPRLTAYEYQGLLLSGGHLEAGLDCIACHSMHGGDPRGMITEAMRGPAACAGCHAAEVAAAAGHSRHPEPVASDCYACHMPRIVYGVMAIHRSHRIEVPRPARHAALDRPNACNQCHLERSPAWAEAALAGWRGAAPPAAPEEAATAEAELAAALYGGDPARRAVALEAAGSLAWARSRAANRQLVPHLLLALEDPYPSSRRFARASLLAIAEGDPALAPLLPALRELDWMRPLDEPRNRGLLPALWQAWRGIDKRAWGEPPPETWLDRAWLPDLARVRARVAASPKRLAAVHIGE
ncbi:MAG: cytochrome c3 family protein [Xanthomonadales bacterium]|nr:cytochrome c3 family protein [Xanthomonadales bacterium]